MTLLKRTIPPLSLPLVLPLFLQLLHASPARAFPHRPGHGAAVRVSVPQTSGPRCTTAFGGAAVVFDACVVDPALKLNVYWRLSPDGRSVETLLRSRPPQVGGYVAWSWGRSVMVGSTAVVAYMAKSAPTAAGAGGGGMGGSGLQPVVKPYALNGQQVALVSAIEDEDDDDAKAFSALGAELEEDGRTLRVRFTQRVARPGDVSAIWAVGGAVAADGALPQHVGDGRGIMDLRLDPSRGNTSAAASSSPPATTETTTTTVAATPSTATSSAAAGAGASTTAATVSTATTTSASTTETTTAPTASPSPEAAAGTPAPCIAVAHLAHLPAGALVFARHRRAAVLCDGHGSCASRGHVVTFRGAPMTMRAYCAAHAACVQRAGVAVNSPRMARGLRVATRTPGLRFTPLAARYSSAAEEVAMRWLVRLGLA